MPGWVISIGLWLSKRSINFVVYAILGIVALGLYQKFFPGNSTKIERIDRQVNVYSSQESQRIPLGGCAMYRLNGEAYWKKPINNPSSNQ